MLPGNSCLPWVGRDCLLPVLPAEEKQLVAGLLLANSFLAHVLVELLPAQLFKNLPLLACLPIVGDLLFDFVLQFGEFLEERLAFVFDAGFARQLQLQMSSGHSLEQSGGSPASRHGQRLVESFYVRPRFGRLRVQGLQREILAALQVLS